MDKSSPFINNIIYFNILSDKKEERMIFVKKCDNIKGKR